VNETINILLPYGYINPTDKDVEEGKKWTKVRNDNANQLAYQLDILLHDYAKKLTQIGYRYDCMPTDFQFAQNEKLREEVASLMEKLEEDILTMIEDYSLNATQDKETRTSVLPWLLALHAKNADNLRETIHIRVTQFLYDTEAQIAAMKFARYDLTKATTRILSTLHSVYSTPEVTAAYRRTSAAKYIIAKGSHKGNLGLSSSGAVNIENLGRNTASQVWSYIQFEEARKEGLDGFIVLRGSTYHCDYCDSMCGFHTIDQDEFRPPFHARCQCYVVFIRKQK
jgi:hypothetical protein